VSSWALVIGIDGYDEPHSNLKGCVRDALGVRAWLLDPAGGGVPPDQLILALSGTEESPAWEVDSVGATKRDIFMALSRLAEQADGQSDRLFFYFAGHGIQVRVNNSDENALLAADFTKVMTDNSCLLGSLYEFLGTTRFREQFFFIDACRNTPWPGELEPGRWTRPRPRELGAPPPQQFVMYATSPGLAAKETGDFGEEGGAFTGALLDGLAGEGTAKVWCSRGKHYEITWSRLFAYVHNAISTRRLEVTAGSARTIQVPQEAVARTQAAEIVLGTFPAEHFGSQQLRVTLDPDSVASTAEVRVLDEVAVPVTSAARISTLPVCFDLPPRTYLIHAMAPEYELGHARSPVALYEPADVTIELIAQESQPADNEDAELANMLENGTGTGELLVRSSDWFAAVEVTTEAGQVLAHGEGTAELSGASPGFYRARVVTPAGEVAEKLVEVEPGDREPVELEAPNSPLSHTIAEIVEKSGVEVAPGGGLEVSEVIGEVAAPEISTMLTLAGAFGIWQTQVGGSRLTSLGVAPMTERLPCPPESAVYLLGGISGERAQATNEALASVAVRLWPAQSPVPEHELRLERFSDVAGLGLLTAAGEPGLWWLSIELPDASPVVWPIALVSGRLSMLVLESAVGGTLKLLQYLPPLASDRPPDPRLLRRLEALQRFELSDRPFDGKALVMQLDDPGSDLVGACLHAYVLGRLGTTDELKHATDELLAVWPSSSDAQVLRAEVEARNGQIEKSTEALERALDAGLPLIGEGLDRLVGGILRYQLDHPHAALASRVWDGYVNGSLWTAWTPGALEPGTRLELAEPAKRKTRPRGPNLHRPPD